MNDTVAVAALLPGICQRLGVNRGSSAVGPPRGLQSLKTLSSWTWRSAKKCLQFDSIAKNELQLELRKKDL